MPRHVHYSKRTEQAETISKTKFTPREIDILACLNSGKSYKSIGVLLSISPKTVDVHVHNIMEKLGCHSREGITAMVEQSALLPPLKKRYLTLLMTEDFGHKLRHIAQLIHKAPPTCLIVDARTESGKAFLQSISQDLRLAGIKMTHGMLEDNLKTDAIIYLTSPELTQEFQVDENQIITAIVQSLEKTKAKPDAVIFLTQSISIDLSKHENIHTLQWDNNPPLLVFEILARLLPPIPVEKMVLQFKQQWGEALDPTHDNHPVDSDIFRQLEEKDNKIATLLKYLRKYNRALWVAVPVSFVIAGGLVWFGLKDVYTSSLCTSPIRSTLSVPSDTYFLKRPNLLAQIEKKLSGADPIQTVVLLAMGGTGKTTLARQYARRKRASVVWEIDAETQETLLSSFAHLAYTLSRTQEEKQELDRIKQLDKLQEYGKKLLHFIQQKLKSQQQWILIFDNVDNFSDIQNFFPNDPEVWGHGKVLITTRNYHVKDSHHLKAGNVVVIKPLDPQEQYNLFTQIMFTKDETPPSSTQRKQIIEFLKQIPPFPLDISSAAYHIKSTGMFYQEYLDNMHSPEVELEKMQSNFIKQTLHYAKTRYEIITFAFKQLIKTCPAIEEVLFFISMIGSQNIPKDLLELHKNKKIVNQFITHMQKFSLLTHRVGQNRYQSLSVHRSTQEIAFLYLSHALSTEKKQKYIDEITHTLERYANTVLERFDIETMQEIAAHLHFFLKHADTLSPENKGSIELLLGRIYFYSNDLKRARQHVENSATYLSRQKNPIKAATVLAYLGAIIQTFGEHKKAKQFLEESLELYKRTLPPHHIDLAWPLMRLGWVYRDLGDYELAEQAIKQSIALYTQHRGEKYFKLAWAQAYLGDLYVRLGHHDKATECYEKSLNIYKNLYGDEHIKTLSSILRLGKAHKRGGSLIKAQAFLEKSYALREKYATDIDNLSRNLSFLGDTYRLLGLYEKGLPLLRRSLKESIKYFGKYNIQTEWRALFLGQMYMDMGEYTKAQGLFEKSLEIHEKHYSTKPKHIKIARVRYYLANTYKQLKKFDQAEHLFKEALQVHAKHYGEDNIEYAAVLRDFGHFYLFKEDYHKAEQMLIQALTIFQKTKFYEAYSCLEYLGDVYQAKAESLKNSNKEEFKKLKEQSTHYFKQAFDIAQATFPKDSTHIERLKTKLKVI